MWIMKFHLVVLIILYLFHRISTEPLALTETTWKDMLCGQWMVEFHAPWCPSCQNYNATWNEFAKAMISKEIKVASIDINEYPSLSGRFRISVLPTIYYVRDGIFRQFNGDRSLNGLKNYIEYRDWQRAEPVSPYFAPDSLSMSFVSKIFDVSVLVKDAYTVLQDQYGWPAWLIYIAFTLIVIIVGLVLGFGVLLIIDYCVAPAPRDYIASIPDDSRDTEDLEESDSQILSRPSKPKKTSASVPTFVTSSTPQRSTTTTSKIRPPSPVEILDDEALLDEVLAANQDDDDDDDDSDNLNALDAAPGTDDDEQNNNNSLRQRRLDQ